MKVAMVQMVSKADLEQNLSCMKRFAREAKEKGADLVVFPEIAYFCGPPELVTPISSEYPRLKKLFADWAKELEIALIPGTLREPLSTGSCANTMLVFSANGSLIAEYRKIFLFKVAIADHRQFDETSFFSAGTELAAPSIGGVIFGLTICFDLRFPEIFRALKKRGANIILLPAAFLAVTGKAHWESLVRARAIENQCFVIAPGLTGLAGDGGTKHGHSLAVGPWGEVLMDMQDREGVEVLDLNLDDIERCAQKVDAWGCRREDLFPIA